ncbi:hypothetical protein BCY86_00610 [Pajaroellobacter abortibovis]|uniref:Uncharacterized protein n=1 Tax=Pajaroellobacter abortibovis TaxID=1882918 RepID=A0A1L6MV03_9BACT|nr:hypothetical protein BCY86_00610 [Pajaroellobacter abortibovis]
MNAIGTNNATILINVDRKSNIMIRMIRIAVELPKMMSSSNLMHAGFNTLYIVDQQRSADPFWQLGLKGG